MTEQPSTTRWFLLAIAVAIIAVGFGTLFSLSVFLLPIEESMHWPRAALSGVAMLGWVTMGVGSFVWGTLSDRIGVRIVLAAGGALLGLGMVLSSQATSLGQFYVTFGTMVGFAVGALYAPLNSAAARWFTARRGLAVGIVSAGIGLGTFVMAPFSRWLINVHDWRGAMLVLGDIAWLVIIPGALLIRETPRRDQGSGLASRTSTSESLSSIARISRAPQFWAIALTHFACCAAHAGPIFHMVTHVAEQGITAMSAATVFGVAGLASTGGRIMTGMLADRFGAKPTLVAILGYQALTLACYLIVGDLGAFYALGIGFGIAYGGVMPLYALVTRECFGEKVMGTAYGAVFLVSCLGMGVGAFGGGWFYDRLGSYAWMYGSAAAVGGLAVVLALTLRRPVAAIA